MRARSLTGLTLFALALIAVLNVSPVTAQSRAGDPYTNHEKVMYTSGMPGSSQTVTPINAHEDKSPASYDLQPPGDIARKYDYFESHLHGRSDTSVSATGSDNNDIQFLEQLRNSLKHLRERVPEFVWGVGSYASFGTRNATLAPTLLVSSNHLGLDLAYQHSFGDHRRIANTFIPLSGDGISFRLDVTHWNVLPAFDKADKATRVFSDKHQKVIHDTICQINDILNMNGNRSKRSNLSLKFLKAVRSQLLNLNNLPIFTDPDFLNELTLLNEQIMIATDAYNRNFASLRTAIIGGYSSYEDIGHFRNIGLSLSLNMPLNVHVIQNCTMTQKDYSHASGLLLASTLQGAWYSPSALPKQNGFISESAIRFGVAIAWQDAFPRYLPLNISNSEGFSVQGWVIRKWRTQAGIEYRRANRVDGAEYYGGFLRWRDNHHAELNASIGYQAQIGTTARFGAIHYFH